MSSFHLRPVSDISPTPSPTEPTTPPGDHSPPLKRSGSSSRSTPPTLTSANGRSRRPLSPSSLRDVDLTQTPDMSPRKYPAPPTGHDLMAMFPPAPPYSSPEMRGGPTSGFFQRQERAFFAQAGKEIVRVRVEVDGAEPDPSKSRNRDTGASRPWPAPGPSASTSAPHHSPVLPSSAASLPYPPSRPSHRGPVPVTPAPLLPITSHPPPPSQVPPNLHSPALRHPSPGMRTPPQDASQSGASNAKSEFISEDYDPDEAWRRPMPYAERRRAGKHTRRVVVR